MCGFEFLVGGGVSCASPLQVDDVFVLEGDGSQRVRHVLLDDLLDALDGHDIARRPEDGHRGPVVQDVVGHGALVPLLLGNQALFLFHVA